MPNLHVARTVSIWNKVKRKRKKKKEETEKLAEHGLSKNQKQKVKHPTPNIANIE